MLEIHGLTFEVAKRALVRGIEATFEPGTFTGIVGPNGAGKSTLLRLLAGELEPSAGEIRLDGKPLSSWSAADLARHRAVLPQHATLTFPLTACEVVAIGRSPHGEAYADTLKLAREILAQVDASAFADQAYPSLSGGEQKRVQFTRALAQLHGVSKTPRLLLLDEPTASLDLKYQMKVLAIARQQAEAGATVVAVLHNLNHALKFCDRVLVLDQGTTVAYDTPQTALTPDLIERVFQVKAQPVSGGLLFSATHRP